MSSVKLLVLIAQASTSFISGAGPAGAAEPKTKKVCRLQEGVSSRMPVEVCRDEHAGSNPDAPATNSAVSKKALPAPDTTPATAETKPVARPAQQVAALDTGPKSAAAAEGKQVCKKVKTSTGRIPRMVCNAQAGTTAVMRLPGEKQVEDRD